MTATAPFSPPPTPSEPQPAQAPGPLPGRQAVRALAVLLVVVAIAFGALNVVTWLGRASSSSAQSFTGVRSVDVGTAFESVTLTGDASGADRATVARTWSWSLREPTMSARVVGGVLQVRSHCRWDIGRGCSGTVRLVVPADVPVKVRSADGAVTLHDLHGRLEVGTADGAIHVAGATGALTLSTADGAITSTGTRSTQVTASTADGHVSLSFDVAPSTVRVSTADGGVDVLVPHDGTVYRVTTSTADGGTDIRVPNAPDGTHAITVHTADGGIRVDYTGTG